MISIDIPMPANCDDCPCSYWIRSGEYEGRMMCNAMESIKMREGIIDFVQYCLVDDMAQTRPENCPIIS